MAKEAKTNNKKEKKSKDKTSFFKSFKAELKRVSWPTPKQLANNTTAVIVIVLILAAIVFVLDFAFESVNKYGIDKIKESVINSNVETNNSSEATEQQTEGNGTTENEETTEVTEGTETTEQEESTQDAE